MLLLTALNDKGNVPVGSGALIQVGLTGALLADLAIDGRLAVAEDGTVRAGDTRPGDELLADVYAAVREHLQGRNVRQVIGGLSHHIGGSWNRVVDRLIDAGVLGRDRPSLLRPTRHPVLDTAARQAVLDQIRAAAAGEGPVSSQVAVVLALIGPCRLLERVAPDPGTRGEAKRRIDRVTAETPFAPGVAKIVDELIVAITVTATTIPPSFVFLAGGCDVSSSGSSGSYMEYPTGVHVVDMPEDVGHYSAVMERLFGRGRRRQDQVSPGRFILSERCARRGDAGRYKPLAGDFAEALPASVTGGR